MLLEKKRLNVKSVLTGFILFFILGCAGVLVLRNLGHSGITFWDEGFHAVVARNLTKHPLKFTLYDQPWLPYDYKFWGQNHIWLHKPPFALWTICLSYLIFGINTFALRLPSAVSLVATAWLTYCIAADLFDKRTGTIAAILHAFNPFLFGSVHGYRFSDHIDIALLLWVEISCWLLLCAIRSGKRRYYILSGITTGIAYLSKSYLALITIGIALVILCVQRVKNTYHKRYSSEDRIQSEGTEAKIRLRDIGLQLLVAIAIVVPWVTYCLIYYRKEFLWEHKRILDHLNTNVENFGASWDRPLFDYMPMFYPLFYVVLIAAVLCLIVIMFKRWNLTELFVLAWGIGVIIPHILTQTKTPSATMISVPPLLICLAAVISRSWRRGDWIYTSTWSAAMLSSAIVSTERPLIRSRDLFTKLKTFAPFIESNFWIIEQLIVFGILLGILLGVYMLVRQYELQKWIWVGLRIGALLVALFYVGLYVQEAHKVTERNLSVPLYERVGRHLQRDLPENACIFLEDYRRIGAHLNLMYYADRSTYMFQNHKTLKRQVEKAREAGAIPYLFSVTERTHNYPLLTEGRVDLGNKRSQRYRIYEIRETQD